MAEILPVTYEWLMPLAPWEPSDRLFKAVESLNHQTWPALRLVVSVDGQLPDHLAGVLKQSRLPVLILQSNAWQGTGPTLASGLLACQSEWVLRADADDCSAPHRAERQLSYLLQNPDLTVLGCQLRESSGNNSIDSFRRVPQDPQKLRCLMNWWNPLNHPTVAFHREKVLSAGSYRGILNFEDWDLWLRLSYRGAKMANLPDVLVTANVDNAYLARRHGLKYAIREVKFFLRCGKEGLIPGWLVLLLLLVRLPLRLLPRSVLASVMGFLRVIFSLIKIDR